MRCPVCGSTVGPSLSFCPRCGAQLNDATRRAQEGSTADTDASPTDTADGAGNDAAASGSVTVNEAVGVDPDDTAPLPFITEDADFLHRDSLSSHFTDAQKESKKRLPMVLIVVMFVLFVIAISTLAIATYYIYQNYVEPLIRELVLPTLYDDEGDADNDANQGDGATGALITQAPAAAPATAAPTAPASPAAPAAPTPPANDGGGTAPPAPVATEDDPAKQAIYNDLLTAYRDAQEDDWQNALGSEYQDLSSLGAIMIMHEDMNVSVTYDQVESGTVSYSYVDLGDDDTLDLVIATVQDDGSYQLLGVFNTDGAEPISITKGAVAMRSYWKLRDDLLLENGAPYSAWEYNTYVYRVSGSELITESAYGYDDYGYWSEDAEGTRTYITLEEYAELQASDTATLDWHPLSEFVEVEPDVNLPQG